MAGLGGIPQYEKKTEAVGIAHVKQNCIYGDVTMEAVGETFKDARSAAQDRAAAHEISCDAHRAALTEHCLQSVARYASPTPLCATFCKCEDQKSCFKAKRILFNRLEAMDG